MANFDISQLGSYVQNNGTEYAMRAVATAPTAKALIDSKNVQFGVKGTAAILKMSSDVSLIPKICGARTGGSTLTLSNKNIVVKPLADEMNLCTGTLWNTFYADSVAKGQTPQEELIPAFANAILTDRASKIGYVNEQLIWRGDLTLTGSTNLKVMDGIGVQVTATTSNATGTTIVERLQNFFLACDVVVRGQEDFRIFISEGIYAEYLIALATKNIYKPTEDLTLFGTTAKLFVTPGLNGLRTIYGMRLSNLQLGMDGEGDADKAEIRYSIETKQYYMDFAYGLGVAVIWFDEALKATVA